MLEQLVDRRAPRPVAAPSPDPRHLTRYRRELGPRSASCVHARAEILANGDRVADDCCGVPCVDPAVLDQVTAVGDLEHLVDVVIGEQDADRPVVARSRTICRMSAMVSGSTPANGSSSRIRSGSQTRQRAISSRRFSPPEQRAGFVLPHVSQAELIDARGRCASQRSCGVSFRPRLRLRGSISRMARMFCSTVSLRKTLVPARDSPCRGGRADTSAAR